MSHAALLEASPFSSSQLTAEETEVDLAALLAEVEAIVPPLWPLKDYVAVNPFLGLAGETFLNGRQQLREVRDCELLPTADYYRVLLQRGAIAPADIEVALQQCVREYPTQYAGWDVQKTVGLISSTSAIPSSAERRYYTLAEIVDQQQQTAWSSHIVNDITRHCSAHYDEGQAVWPSPWKDLPLYQAWKEAAQLSRRMDYLGIDGYQSVVKQLPEKASDAIVWSLHKLGVPVDQWRGFLLSELFSVAGWASFIKYRVHEAANAGQSCDDLVGLLAMRLAYDVALAAAESHRGHADIRQLVAAATSIDASGPWVDDVPAEVLSRYVLQVAVEVAQRNKLVGQILSHSCDKQPTARKAVQMVFCIDVRSEVMRRHLEAQSSELETFGFAGFFGMAFEYVPLGEKNGPAQCPVLLNPAFQVPETVLNASQGAAASAIAMRRDRRIKRKVWKSFQTSAVSCFSFVESLGLFYFAKLLTDSLRLTRPVDSSEHEGLPREAKEALGPDLHGGGKRGLSLGKKIDLAEALLRNLGLTDRFARIVVICGHAAEVVNNPHKAGLDCGACGGHSGEPNARVAAAVLNDPQVRAGLESRGIHVPDDTSFVPAVHNTTTDEIRLLDTAQLPSAHRSTMAQLHTWISDAGKLSRCERSRRHESASANDAFRRSRDWSEVRPEWGLAGNAAFIVAPRSRTAGLELGGRAFLHSYDQHKDPELKVLELIMTAPMIVTSWINLQYYASAVDNRSFGSGNKVIHNVVGQFGVLSGNGGDLMTGLSWQSVHDGQRLQHEPLRLLVVIDATRSAVEQIIRKHTMVRDLVSNGWISLVVLEGRHSYRWNANHQWEAESIPCATALAS